jgi:hypothetical protein
MTDYIESAIKAASIDIVENSPGAATVLYTPSEGDPVAGLKVNFTTFESFQVGAFEGTSWVSGITVVIPLHLISGRLPEIGETLETSGGDTYKVVEIIEIDQYFVKVGVRIV